MFKNILNFFSPQLLAPARPIYTIVFSVIFTGASIPAGMAAWIASEDMIICMRVCIPWKEELSLQANTDGFSFGNGSRPSLHYDQPPLTNGSISTSLLSSSPPPAMYPL
jgi:hypothetical protein